MVPGGPGGQDAGGASSLRGSGQPRPDLTHHTRVENRYPLPSTSAGVSPCWHTQARGDKLLRRSQCGSLCPGGGQGDFLSLWLAEKSQVPCSELTSKNNNNNKLQKPPPSVSQGPSYLQDRHLCGTASQVGASTPSHPQPWSTCLSNPHSQAEREQSNSS